MYFHFKPEFWYWKIGIMIRKFLVVFAGMEMWRPCLPSRSIYLTYFVLSLQA
jgi:hypothetical protein